MTDLNLLVATAASSYVNQALDELRLYDKALKVFENAGNGILVIQPSINKHEFNSIVIKNKLIFTRHIHTVDIVLDIDEQIEPEQIKEGIKAIRRQSQSGEKVAVQIRKTDIELKHSPIEFKTAIDELLVQAYSAVNVIKNPDRIISLLFTKNRCYMGESRSSDNLTDWTGGMIHYKKSEEDISRAKYKLMEAIQIFGIDMSAVHKALDLGAAPGGWTSVLLEYDIEVTAVDTGELDQRLKQNKKLTYINGNAAELQLPEESFDMLTSDISWNPIHTAKMVKTCTNALKSGGLAVVTVKLMNEKITRTIREVKEIYSEVFDILNARQLFHNRDEITLYMKKR